MCLDKDKYDSRPVLYNSKRSTMYYKRGEVYYIIDDGRCIGNEIMKTRPAVIVSDSSVNKNLDVLVVVPLSSKVKKYSPTHIRVECDGITATALVEQVTTITVERIDNNRFLGHLSESEMTMIEYSLSKYLGFSKTLNLPSEFLLQKELEEMKSYLDATEEQLQSSRSDCAKLYTEKTILEKNLENDMSEETNMSKRKQDRITFKTPAEMYRIDKLFDNISQSTNKAVGKLRRGEIYYIINENDIGKTNAKGAPAIIISNNEINSTENRVSIIPLTQNPEKPKHSVELTIRGDLTYAVCNGVCNVLISQIGDFVVTLTEDQLKTVEKGIIKAFGLKKTVKAMDDATVESNPVAEPEASLTIDSSVLTSPSNSATYSSLVPSTDNVSEESIRSEYEAQLKELKDALENAKREIAEKDTELQVTKTMYDKLLDKMINR